MITITQQEINDLQNSIKCKIITKDVDRILSQDTIDKMSYSLAVFQCKAIAKFIKGQKEHGGNLADRNLDEEISMECIDTFWYNEAKAWKDK